MRLAATLAITLGLLSAGCDDFATYAYFEDPYHDDRGRQGELELAEGTAVSVVFLVSHRSDFDGVASGTDASSADEGIVRLGRSTREGTVHEGAGEVTGHVFVIEGVTPGETEIDVSEDGDPKGTIHVTVLPQARR